MKPNAVRGVVAVVFLIAVIGAYFLGKGAGEREAAAEADKLAGGKGGSAGPLSGISGEQARRDGGRGSSDPEGDEAGALRQRSVKSIIARARVKMQGGMMNMSGMMRALAMLDDVSDEQIQEALAEVERSVKEPQQKMMFGMLLLARWAETDGPAALAYADEHFSTKNPMMMGIKTSVLSSWAQSDPEAAWDWYEEQEPSLGGGAFGNSRAMALMGIVGSLALQDVDKAFERLDSIEDQSERQMALQGLGQAIWEEDRRADILTKIEAMEDATEKMAARNAVISQWSQIDPDGAVEWADTLGDEDRSAVIKQIGQSLSWADPQRSAELQLSVATTAEERSTAYSNAISSWAYNDPIGAGEWLAEQDQGPDLDGARRQFASSIAQKDPEGAMAWADSITADDDRTSAVQNVYTQWAGKDREAADVALEGTDLSAEKIAELKSMEIAPQTTHGILHSYGVGAAVGATVTTEVEVTEELALPPDEQSSQPLPEPVEE